MRLTRWPAARRRRVEGDPGRASSSTAVSRLA